jgi:predicted dehydrogenase
MIGIAVIGCGYWGPNLIRNFSTTPGARVSAVCDLNAERLRKVQEQNPGLHTTPDYAALLVRTDVDAVAIATPVSSHFPLAKQALEAGKHVLVEKPMTATVAQAEELVALAAKKGLVLMVDHTFAYTSAVRKIKELVVGGDLGELLYYDSVRINLGLFQHDVNVLWDLAVHDLAIMDFALGQEPVAVSATGLAHLPGQHEDVAYLTCFFESNLIAHFHLNWLSPLKIRRTIIGGDRKSVVYDDLEPSEKLRIYDRGATLNEKTPESVHRTLVDYRMGDMWAPHLGQGEALRAESTHFIECIMQKRTPITDGQAGLRVVRILEAANQSLAQRGAPVNIK